VLEKLTYEDLNDLKDIIQENIHRCGVGSRTSVEYIIATLQLGMMNENVAFWTDDKEEPTMLLVMSGFKNIILNETTAIINSIFVRDEEDPDLVSKVNLMIDTAEAYARQKSCDAIMGASWVYKGGKNIQSLWKDKGYEPQEYHNVKLLK